MDDCNFSARIWHFFDGVDGRPMLWCTSMDIYDLLIFSWIIYDLRIIIKCHEWGFRYETKKVSRIPDGPLVCFVLYFYCDEIIQITHIPVIDLSCQNALHHPSPKNIIDNYCFIFSFNRDTLGRFFWFVCLLVQQ